MVEDDGWVRTAMEDAAAVAEVILRFRSRAVVRTEVVFPVRWGRRKRRSHMPTRCEFSSPAAAAATDSKRKEGEVLSARCSPRTPLSWSGGGGMDSPSTGDGDGDEKSTSFSPPRSKVVSGETTIGSTKKSRKKKTYAELREEESLLLKERIHLRKEISTFQATYEEQSAENHSLKRMKFCFNVEAKTHSPTASNKREKAMVSRCKPKAEDTSSNLISSIPAKCSKIEDKFGDARCLVNAVSNHNRPVFLFDLNMTPPEEETVR